MVIDDIFPQSALVLSQNIAFKVLPQISQNPQKSLWKPRYGASPSV